jgi:PPOX class probable F420-dependent enzyme
MPDMTAEERRAFLMDGTRTAKLATTRADGRPHVTPIWFLLDGDDVVFTTFHESLKAKAIQRDPTVSMCVDDQAPPYSYVMVDGVAELTDDDPTALLDWATRIAARYMGDDLAETYGQRNGVPGELLVRVRPTKIVAKARVSDF